MPNLHTTNRRKRRQIMRENMRAAPARAFRQMDWYLRMLNRSARSTMHAMASFTTSLHALDNVQYHRALSGRRSSLILIDDPHVDCPQSVIDDFLRRHSDGTKTERREGTAPPPPPAERRRGPAR